LNSNWDWVELLTFSTQLKSSYSYFQLDATQLDWKLSQLDLIHQELKLDVKRVKYRKFFDFWLLHYLLIKSHEEKHEDHLIESHKEKHENHLIKSHDKKHEEKHEEKHEDRLTLIESHDKKTW